MLGRGPQECRAFSLRTRSHRYVDWLDLHEQLYDLRSDPDQFEDLGRDATSAALRSALRDPLPDFLARRKHRTTVSNEVVQGATDRHKAAGIYYGQW